jgi:hypothetical protein
MTKKKIIRYILIVLAAFLIIAQFFAIDKTNPESDPVKHFINVEKPPQQVADLLKGACFDCHSNNTKYPWYTNVAPVSWWIKGHIDNGREHLNFSNWTDYSAKKANHKLEECYEVLEGKEMPMLTYWLVHPEANLSADQRAIMVNYFKGKYAASE